MLLVILIGNTNTHTNTYNTILSLTLSRTYKIHRYSWGWKVAVRLEFLRQKRLGIYDPDSMAKISEAQTLLCSKRAQLTGLIHSRNICGGSNYLIDTSSITGIRSADASANARAA